MSVANKKFLCVIFVNFVYCYQSVTSTKGYNGPNGNPTMMSQCGPSQDMKKSNDNNTPENNLLQQSEGLRADDTEYSLQTNEREIVKFYPTNYMLFYNKTTCKYIYPLTTENLGNRYFIKIESNKNEIVDEKLNNNDIFDKQLNEKEIPNKVPKENEILDKETNVNAILDKVPEENEILDKETNVNVILHKVPKENEILDKETNVNAILDKEPNENEILYNGTLQLNVTKCGVSPPGRKIFGGDVVNIDEYPWLALLDYRSNQKGRCGGSLITNRLVITAAHCIDTAYGEPIQVRLAEYNTSSYPTDTVVGSDGVAESINVTIIAVEWAKKHPDYKSHLKSNDIGLIKMLKSVEFSDFIKPICLPEINFVAKFTTNTTLITAGWGEDEVHLSSEVKKGVGLPYKPLSDCIKEQFKVNNKQDICAGGEMNKDSCHGDSGGPLMYRNGFRYVLVGIVKSGYYACGLGKPSVFTNVYGYLNWIKGFI